MQTTSEQIRKALRGVWPNIQFVWLQDRIYIMPSISVIEGILLSSGICALRFNGELMDCDDYALLANAHVKRQRIDVSDSLTSEDNFHFSFGEAFGDLVRGQETPHTCNVVLAQEGLFLIEPQTYEYWEPKVGLDNILIVKM